MSLFQPYISSIEVIDEYMVAFELRIPFGTFLHHLAHGAIKAVDGVSISMSRGEVLAIVGESGSGKSTLELSIARLLPRNAEVVSGTILLSGVNVLKLSSDDIRKIRGSKVTIVFQEPSAALNPLFKVKTFLRDVILSHSGSKLPGNEADLRIEELLKKVGIPAPREVVKCHLHELSGGMKQRVLIAVAIANDPELTVLDEPTSALDVPVQAQILNLLKDLQESLKVSYVFVSHDLAVVSYISHRVAVMYAGKLVEVNPTEEIFSEPLHPYTSALLMPIPKIGSNEI